MKDTIKEQFSEAVEIARFALAEARKQPTVRTKRGADRPNPMFRVYADASMVAIRWARELRARGDDAPTLDEELDRLLGD